MSDFRQWSRLYNPEDKCPLGHPAIFASDFKLMGEKRVRVCETCQAVYEGDKRKDSVAVFPKEGFYGAT